MKSKKQLHVHLYQVATEKGSETISDRLTRISNELLADRNRRLGYSMRLEDFRAPTKTRPYWLLDFVKLNFDGGPGKAGLQKPAESFDLSDEEGFSEETAVLLDPKTSFAVVQYNHQGPRAQAIAEYLGIFASQPQAGYEFLLQLRQDAQARLKDKKIFSRLVMGVAPARLSDAYRKKYISMTSMLELQTRTFGGDVVTITIALERGRNKKATLSLKKYLGAFFGLANEDQDAVKTLKIAGRDNAGESIDLVDLLSEKEQKSFSGLEMDSGLRYLRKERWARLESAFSEWKAQKVIS